MSRTLRSINSLSKNKINFKMINFLFFFFIVCWIKFRPLKIIDGGVGGGRPTPPPSLILQKCVLFNKRTVPLGKDSSKRNYFIDGRHSIYNFNTTELHRFS